MHMLCLITYKVRSENGYGFLRPGLKMGMGNFFGLILGLDLEMRAAHPHQKCQGVPPRDHKPLRLPVCYIITILLNVDLL